MALELVGLPRVSAQTNSLDVVDDTVHIQKYEWLVHFSFLSESL